MTAPSTRRGRLTRPLHLLSAALALAGLGVATVATSLAMNAGEVPVTVLPFGGALADLGLAALAGARLAAVVVLWLVLERLGPAHQPHFLAAAGVFWFLWGVWQAWVLLART